MDEEDRERTVAMEIGHSYEPVRGGGATMPEDGTSNPDGKFQNRPCGCTSVGAATLVVLVFLSCVTTVVVVNYHEDATDDPFTLRNTIMDRPTLQFRNRNADDSSSSGNFTFKIVQITDIHLGEAENLDWGPEQDRKTYRVLDKVLTLEAPDLILLSGDQLTANNCKENATAYYRQLGTFLSKYNTPWAMIFGNHDDLGYVDPETEKISPTSKYSRRDLLHIDQSFPLSLSRGGPIDVFGTSNYILNISYPDESLASQIYLFDSGGGALPEAIHESQLEWFHQHQAEVPAIAFQHIPTETHHFVDKECTGFQGEGIAALRYDAGIVQALVNSQRFSFLAVGHNHGNDYCCAYSNTTSFKVCFGRHSGYGGYGKWERGVRVYELMTIPSDSTSMGWKSWVRLESGKVIYQI